MVQLITERTVRARKPHRCQTCTAVTIQPGQEYVRQVYAHDGRAYAWVQCDPCRNMAGRVYSYCGSPDDGVGWPEYMDWAEDYAAHGDDTEQEMARAYLARVDSGRTHPLDLPDHRE